MLGYAASRSYRVAYSSLTTYVGATRPLEDQSLAVITDMCLVEFNMHQSLTATLDPTIG